ncbi:MAG: TlpA family protein disulfide reductase [Muribaculaceae bacterium]|nr:TlpA family protein disulfide reductase [Muribaculaceae bacterium]
MKSKLYLFISIIFSFALISCVSEDDPEPRSLLPGDRCPEFSTTFSDGSVITTSDLRGLTSVIVFFNTSCPDCRKELPEIQKVYEFAMNVNRPIGVFCIAREEGSESIERFWKENGFTMPYSAQTDRSVYNLFASSVIPRIYVVSPELKITAAWSDNPVPTAEEIIKSL